MSKYNREKFMKDYEVNNFLEKDLLSSYWELFKVIRPIRFEMIYRSDIGRPDLCSLRIYNRIDWWWILSKINMINDWYNDVFIGMDLIVPSVEDIEEYYLAVKNLRGSE